ncbi:hypothetical protein D3C77_252810 [compost metagenome]
MLYIRVIILNSRQTSKAVVIKIDQILGPRLSRINQVIPYFKIIVGDLHRPYHRFNLGINMLYFHFQERHVLVLGITDIHVIDHFIRVKGHQRTGSQNDKNIGSNQAALKRTAPKPIFKHIPPCCPALVTLHQPFDSFLYTPKSPRAAGVWGRTIIPCQVSSCSLRILLVGRLALSPDRSLLAS